MRLMRCAWVPEGNHLYEEYHDREWGVPVHNDRIHFEFLTLESAQAGLSWETILKRRAGYAKAFADFDPEKVSLYGEKEFDELINNDKIIRNKQKIRAAINNAGSFLKISQEFGSFDNYIWRFVKGKTIDHQCKTVKDVPVYTAEAEALSSDLKKRGFSFVGPTIIYAHMQATGLINDHTIDCFRH